MNPHRARLLGPRSASVRAAVHSLVDRLRRGDGAAALDRWRAAGGNRHAQFAWNRATEALAAAYGVERRDADPAAAIFAVQTHFALVVKRFVRRTTAVDRSPAATAADLAALDLGRLPCGTFVGDLFLRDLFSWAAPDAAALREIDAALARAAPNADADDDPLRPLYEAAFPRRYRHAAGEYYTPSWLARHVLDAAGCDGRPGLRALDPTCGSGVFLREAIRRARVFCGAGVPPTPQDLAAQIAQCVVGFDSNPLAVVAARANYVLALGDRLPRIARLEPPVHLRDALLDPPGDAAPFDYVVGNPPWIAWDDLPEAARRATDPLWRRYGLFSLSAAEARHGGGKKDLAMLVVYAAADRWLKPGGRLAMVVPQTAFQTKGAGDGFRRFRLGDGAPLGVLRVDDLVAVRPFDAANWTATLVLEKGAPTAYPVPYVRWTAAGREPCDAWPIDPARPTSPWIVWPRQADAAAAHPLAGRGGPSDYRAHLGANTGGANGVYWLETFDRPQLPPAGAVWVRNQPGRGKRSVPAVEAAIEADLLYPLLRWGDVARWRAAPRLCLLLAQDPQARRGLDPTMLQTRYPLAHAYLAQFEELLLSRAAYRRYQERGPFYSMYDVGPYTVAPIKVVWRRMDRRVEAAVVDAIDHPILGRRAVVPQETCVLAAVESYDEAHYLCALLNSAAVGALVAAHSVRGGKGFGTPGMLDYLGLRRFDPQRPEHVELARHGRTAHDRAARGGDVAAAQAAIDALAAAL